MENVGMQPDSLSLGLFHQWIALRFKLRSLLCLSCCTVFKFPCNISWFTIFFTSFWKFLCSPKHVCDHYVITYLLIPFCKGNPSLFTCFINIFSLRSKPLSSSQNRQNDTYIFSMTPCWYNQSVKLHEIRSNNQNPPQVCGHLIPTSLWCPVWGIFCKHHLKQVIME